MRYQHRIVDVQANGGCLGAACVRYSTLSLTGKLAELSELKWFVNVANLLLIVAADQLLLLLQVQQSQELPAAVQFQQVHLVCCSA
jgi:hypothetical protein